MHPGNEANAESLTVQPGNEATAESLTVQPGNEANFAQHASKKTWFIDLVSFDLPFL